VPVNRSGRGPYDAQDPYGDQDGYGDQGSSPDQGPYGDHGSYRDQGSYGAQGSPAPQVPQAPRPVERGIRHRRDTPHTGRRRWGRWLLSGALVILVAVGGAGIFYYRQLNGNLTQDSLFNGTGVSAGTEKADPFGRVPINILVIGSDTRSSAANCKLGGDCHTGPAANADVEMLVHVSADRSNITAMSIPRDTVTDLPGCKNTKTGAAVGARYGQINGTLTYGPGCTVAAVHQLTGVPIDHFVMVDFAGVISMSDSVGGVQVCVSDNVYDPYSHLKLAKGKHTLKGLAALEFVRSRHGFGDGSDLGRTYAQHAFLSAVIRSVKRKGVLLNPTKVLSLAQAATKALTVDNGLGSIKKLIDLGTDLNKVDGDRVTFTTMQTAADPANPNRVVVAPAARNLFSAIINDRSLSAPGGGAGTATAGASPTPTATPTVTVAPATVKLSIRNGSGQDGRALDVAAALTAKGFTKTIATSTAASVSASTRIHYGAGLQAQALTLAKAIKLPASAVSAATTSTGVSLLIGTDWTSGTTYPSRADTAKAALDQAHSQTASTSSCVPVSHQRTVSVNGVPMTPVQAFSASPDKKVSAP
jgi:LCP family protein required for cell wall assembly